MQVKDGRVLVGEFSCIDKQGNIILSNTFEELTTDGRSETQWLAGRLPGVMTCAAPGHAPPLPQSARKGYGAGADTDGAPGDL